MTAVPPLPMSPGPRGVALRGLALVRRAWERRSWYFAGAVAAFYVAAPFMSAGYITMLFEPKKNVGGVEGQLLADLVNATVLMLVLSLADTAVEDGARQLRAYAVGLLVGAFVASLVQWEMLEALGIDTFNHRMRMPLPHRLVQMEFVLASNLMVGGLLLWVHVQWRETRRSAQALHQGEHERMVLAQQAETARLLALQSRIEPQWLFDVMGRVRALWRRDPRAGAALLDDTIVTLRHAMPPRTMQSTLARECALLDGQLRLRAVLRPGVALALRVEVPPELAHARLAPLVLWPLVQWLLEAQRAPTSWLLSAYEYRSAAGKPRLAMRLHSADARWPSGEGVLEVLRTRLVALHGPSAELKAATDAEGVAIRLEVALRQVDNRDA